MAYEITMQLIGENQYVEFLGLLDTFCPNHNTLRKHQWRSKHTLLNDCLLASCEEFYERRQNTNSKQAGLSDGAPSKQKYESLNELKEKIDQLNFDALLKKCRELSLLPWYFVDRSDTEIQQYIARLLAHEEALTHYSVFPLPIPIHLFIAQDKPINKEGDIESSSPLLNWDKVLPIEKIHVIPVPGDHLSMMDVHVSSLGQAVTQAINQPPPSPLVRTNALFGQDVSL